MDQVRIHGFLEQTKMKRSGKDKNVEGGGLEPVIQEHDKLRKKVTDLMKKQKLHAARRIVGRHDNSKPWGQDARAKVCFLFQNHW